MGTRRKTGPEDTDGAASYEVVALVLQGGGALGAYQAGVYQGLHEAGIRPNWVAGISIGSINAAIIAGSPEDERVERLRGFWETICRPAFAAAMPWAAAMAGGMANLPPFWGSQALSGQISALQALFSGQPGFFKPRFPPPYLVHGGGAESTSFYDTTPLVETLRQFVDFDLLNSGSVRASFGAVNVRTGNFAYFDSRKINLGPEHIMASGALPPGFPSIEIEGEHYWDGGIVSNTPLSTVLTADTMHDTLVFQVDLWPARGGLPTSMEEVAERQKDIQYSSRTRLVTDQLRRVLKLRHGLQRLLARLPEDERNAAEFAEIRRLSHTPATNIVNLIYESKHLERFSKDYEFGADAMREHWESGLADIRSTLAKPGILARPTVNSCFVTHDIHRNG